ncbi:cobalt-precorrin-6A reductase [Stappia taiwanensis]|uniref:Cobalt-precorrin-6A reductase n=1 Tax=Stappia taiwanensis TaxID=992267 RepID=A0A838XU93_9HYPH|nr:cobalt-precorrin-6A reductase [Stappia taiwanensis]MBA4612601.1 cobalt-precorrin-6A reductase [Stappia taiwanensis]GGE89183.1 precorrin-6A reductase [Stappia taiwanensis]
MIRLLILGGTGDARKLAQHLTEAPCGSPSLDITLSLAGAVTAPGAYPCRTRIGGFGGIDGLCAYLTAERIDAVVDATHPFAGLITANAHAACRQTGTPLLRLLRPAWQPVASDRWIEVGDLENAARRLPAGARALLAIGRKEIGVFAGRRDIWCLMRMIDPPSPGQALPPGKVLLARPDAREEAEAALCRSHGLTHVVAKNSGGGWGYAKIAAARALGLPVVMVSRPPEPDGNRVSRAEDVAEWISRLGSTTSARGAES